MHTENLTNEPITYLTTDELSKRIKPRLSIRPIWLIHAKIGARNWP